MTRVEAYVAMLEGNFVSHYDLKGIHLYLNSARKVTNAPYHMNCDTYFHEVEILADSWEIVEP